MYKRSPVGRPSAVSAVIEVRGILGDVVENLGVRIVGGEWGADVSMPREHDFVEELKVSRSVIREALRILGAKGLIRSRTSDGTRVQPRSEWRLLDPDIIDWRIKAGDEQSLLKDLLKVRLVLEPSAAYNATLVATDEDRARVEDAWQHKLANYHLTASDSDEKRQAFIQADVEFHRAIVTSNRSELLDQLFVTIEAAMRLSIDLQLSAMGRSTDVIGPNAAHQEHETVYLAFMRGDPEAARSGMLAVVEAAISDANTWFSMMETGRKKRRPR